MPRRGIFRAAAAAGSSFGAPGMAKRSQCPEKHGFARISAIEKMRRLG